jgi:hypothetical protein
MDYVGPEGELRYNSTLYLMSTVDGVGGQRHVLAALAPENRSVFEEDGRVPGPK